MTSYNKIISSFASLVLPAFVYAQTPLADNSRETDAEDIDKEMREDFVVIPDEADDIDIPIPSFIKRNANHIIYNGADWTGLRRAFEMSKESPVSIVHIGDSHVQADINTSTVRELLQYDFGNAGRGLVSPLKICGTNQPTV
ncbi:MAG: hypothetical protein K2F76_09750, partial [Duncaniella dubosii]|nr:hypothetical protein [Duncaniella dubosii]